MTVVLAGHDTTERHSAADGVETGVGRAGRQMPERGRSVVLMNRPDFETAILRLPRLRPDAIHGFLSFRIRSLYPAHPEETVFDYRLVGPAGSRRAWVFITRSAALESHRKLGDKLLLPFTVVKGALPRLVRDGGTVVFWHPRWVEVLAIAGTANKLEEGSHVILRHGSLLRDAEL